MRLINTKAHAALDYLLGIVLLFCPTLFDTGTGAAGFTCIAFAIFISALALFTKFEWSWLKIVPLRLHLWLDMIAGIILASSPWLFGFNERVIKPHLVFGLSLTVTAALTDRVLYVDYKRSIGIGNENKDREKTNR